MTNRITADDLFDLLAVVAILVALAWAWGPLALGLGAAGVILLGLFA